MIPGKYYRIPAIRVGYFLRKKNLIIGDGFVKINRFTGFGGWIPLLNRMSVDESFIDVNGVGEHAHIDWRFARDDLFSKMKTYGNPVIKGNWPLPYPYKIHDLIVMRKMLCRRTINIEKIQNSEILSNKYCKAILKDRCPHRGVSIEQMEEDGHLLICPAHGLKWRKDNGISVSTRECT